MAQKRNRDLTIVSEVGEAVAGRDARFQDILKSWRRKLPPLLTRLRCVILDTLKLPADARRYAQSLCSFPANTEHKPSKCLSGSERQLHSCTKGVDRCQGPEL